MGKFRKRTASAVLGLALAVSAAAGAELPADAAGCSASFSSFKTITKGSDGVQAGAVECLLTGAGYKVSRNRSISTNDANQIAKFRTSVGLGSHRVVDGRAWSALISRGKTPTLKPGAKGADVLRLQLALRASGYRVPANRVLDATTVRVLKAAQKSYRLPQSGTATVRVWKLLQGGDLMMKTAPKKVVAIASSSSKGDKALAFAKKQLGESYRYGSAGPSSWDCSGLTMGAWKSAGVNLPHSSQSQYSNGRKVSKSSLRAGDLVFFYSGPSHVGIYAGGGKIIHASKPGTPVQYIPMKYMPYKGAVRPG